jgi:hypothetical protein
MIITNTTDNVTPTMIRIRASLEIITMVTVTIITRRDADRCYGGRVQNSKRDNVYVERACFFCQTPITHTVRSDAIVWYTPPETDRMVQNTAPRQTPWSE